MKTKDFICICLGLYDSTCKKIDDICDDFGVDFSTDEFNEWISWRGQNPDIQLGNLIISDLYRKVIKNAMDDFGEWLDEEKFDFEVVINESHTRIKPIEGFSIVPLDAPPEVLDCDIDMPPISIKEEKEKINIDGAFVEIDSDSEEN